jgi:hypothetical protein
VQHGDIYVTVPHFGFRNNINYLLPAVDAVDTLQSDLKRYKAGSEFGLLGPEHSDCFRMDCKPQHSNGLNIKLKDELQRCLASKEQKCNVTH